MQVCTREDACVCVRWQGNKPSLCAHVCVCGRVRACGRACARGGFKFACAGLRGCATAASAESHLAVEHMEKNTSGCLCVCLLGHNGCFAAHICVRVCVCVCNQRVSAVCMCASVSPALVSLCLCVISPELAAQKHQRETSALCIYRLVCKCVHVLVCARTCVCVCVCECVCARVRG